HGGDLRGSGPTGPAPARPRAGVRAWAAGAGRPRAHEGPRVVGTRNFGGSGRLLRSRSATWRDRRGSGRPHRGARCRRSRCSGARASGPAARGRFAPQRDRPRARASARYRTQAGIRDRALSGRGAERRERLIALILSLVLLLVAPATVGSAGPGPSAQ